MEVKKMNEIILCDKCRAIKNMDDLCSKCAFYITYYCRHCNEASVETCLKCKEARAFLESDDKRQSSSERTDRNHIVQMDLDFAEDKKLITSQQRDTLDTLIDETDNSRILEMFSCLTETQKRRFVAHYIDGKTFRAIASEEGVNHTKIQKSIEQARKKLKKFFK
jgi:RNA polymerase sigma factor (sigma-70 family)